MDKIPAPVMFVSFMEASGPVYLFKRMLEDRKIGHTHVVMGAQRLLTVLSTKITTPDIAQLIKVVKEKAPRVIAFSITTTDVIDDVLTIVAHLRLETDAFMIVGGTGASLEPERLIDSIDGICIGEGIDPFAEFIDAYLGGGDYRNLQNFWFRDATGLIKNPLRPLIDVNQYPIPSIEGVYYQIYRGHIYLRQEPAYAYMFCSVGCPMQCTYCSSPYLGTLQSGTYCRTKSVPKIMEELSYYRSKGLSQELFFFDEIFPWDVHFLEEFCRAYKAQIDVPFGCWGHPAVITEHTIELLAGAGLQRIRIGIQTFSERLRLLYGRRETNTQIVNACRLLNKYNIDYEVEFIIGPLDTVRDFMDYVRWIPRVRGRCTVIFHNYCLMPKTKLREYLLEHNPSAASSRQWAQVSNFNRSSGFYALLHFVSLLWFFITHPRRIFTMSAVRMLLCTQVTIGRLIYFAIDQMISVFDSLRHLCTSDAPGLRKR